MSRKLFLLISVFTVLALFLAACGSETAEEETAVPPTEEVAEEPMEEPTEAPMEEATEAPMEEATEAPMEEATEAPMEEATEAPAEMEPCAPSMEGGLAGVDPRGQQIVWWHNHSGSREEQLIPLLEEFNNSNECGITLEGQNQGGYDDIRDKVNNFIAAGDVPAALLVGYQNDEAFYQLNDTLVDLNEYVDDPYWGFTAEEKADFFPSFFGQSVHPAFGNQRLGLPPNRSMEVLFYNQTWLEELGFDGPPTTPEEFKEMACAAADSKGDGTGGYIIRDDASAVAAWTLAFGGDILNAEGTGYSYDNEATLGAFTLLKEMYDEGCSYFFTEGYPDPEFSTRGGIFAQGSTSGIPYYESGTATFAEDNGREQDEWGITAIPHTTADPVQNVYGGDVMISRTTPEQQLAAWVFLKWFTSPEIMARWDEISGYFPTRESAVQYLGDYIAEYPQRGQGMDLLPYSSFEPQLISYDQTRRQASEVYNEIMQLGDGWTQDDIMELLVGLTEFGNDVQEELMAEIN
ncbi:MAG: extracellular solute-binding protein [Candidatus Promineifilaceae bacterium]